MENIENLLLKAEEIIGTFDKTKYTNLYERIEAREQYNKLKKEIIKILANGNIEIKMTNDSYQSGLTASGLPFMFVKNHGFEQRSRYCGTLEIDGKTIFTSGTISKALEYISKN